MSPPLLDVAGKTDPGKVRERNEDSIAMAPELGLLIVADGMGGHNSGEVASGLATDTILKFGTEMLSKDKEILPPGGDKSLSVRAQQVAHFVETANTVIFEKSRSHVKNQGMGTTIVTVLGVRLFDSRPLNLTRVTTPTGPDGYSRRFDKPQPRIVWIFSSRPYLPMHLCL